MGDLATEIEQMQNDLNAFDDELDALEQNGGEAVEGAKDRRRKRTRSSNAEENGRRSELEEGEEEDDDDDENKNKRKLKSAVVVDARRKSSISKEDINKAQIAGAAGKKRASRLFANLLGTLRTFDEKSKEETVADKRAEIDKKVDEKIATDRRRIIEEKRELMKKRLEKEKLLGLLQDKQAHVESCKEWEAAAKERMRFILTKAGPPVLWAPNEWDSDTERLCQDSAKTQKDTLKSRRKEWTEYAEELDGEIARIKKDNDFEDADLVVNGKSKTLREDARNIIRKVENNEQTESKRLVITKTVNNDTRRVKPRDDDREKKSKKERRKEIEIKRKRRHASSSSEEESEEEYVERTKQPMVMKDVRRVAAKEEPPKSPEPPMPVNRRRITVKAPRQSDSSRSEQEKAKRRRVARRSDSDSDVKKVVKQERKRSDTSNSESEPEPTPPRRSSRRR